MEVTSLILGSVLVCSALAYEWEGLDYYDNHLEEVEGGEKAMIPGMCWGCKWILKKVKKSMSDSSTQEDIQKKLIAACDKIGFLKSACKAFLKRCLSVLVEELSTTDDVKTICVNVKACKPKEFIYI